MTERRNILQESLAAIERLQARLKAAEQAAQAPIAIVGAGCRYPGGVESPDDLWRVLRDGVDAVATVPADRWDADAWYDPDPMAPGKMVTRRGGFLSQVDRFDPQFFGISPREAATMDPQQRLLLETATEALQSAGIATDSLAGSATGVFVGITTGDYGQLLRRDGIANSDVYSATGSALNAAAGRISFTFGLQGPCVALDTACSSSLVAVHLACQSLRTGESQLALAGGVNLVLSPDAMVLFSKWGMMAPDGACKTFDAAADGFVRAEGCAVVALKRLDDALAAGDPILAVIRGSAVNSDGRSSGLTVPNGPAQQAVLRRALASAGLAPADIDYVEAHGTGTPLGDPIEVEALGAVMGAGRASADPLWIGSVKTNLGHTEAASGLAGLLKVALSLRHESIPPHLHFATPNPGIAWDELPLRVPTAAVAWPRGARVRRAGVSSFGFSGTNAHVVLEEAPVREATMAPAGASLVVLSGHDEGALRGNAGALADRLVADPALSVADIATTMSTGRAHLARRAAFVATRREDLVADLRQLAAGQHPNGVSEGAVRPGERSKVAFVFSGQGSQFAGMGQGLYRTEPIVRDTLDRAARALAGTLERPLLDVMFGADGDMQAIHQTAYAQPALFALGIALVELWRSWGVTPAIVAGHSIGEIAAACVAGVFSFEDGLALAAERGRLMQALPAGGAMAAVFADEAAVAARLGGHGGQASIAAINGPEETVVSGDAAAVDALVAAFAAAGVRSRALEVSHAFHSHRLEPMLAPLGARAATITHAAPTLALVSNVTGEPFASGRGPDAAYWPRHARQPVRFAASVAALRVVGATAIVEIGPQATLLGLLARCAPEATWTAVASLRRGRDDREQMLWALGSLHVRGVNARWQALATGRRVALPTYAFQRERHWIDGPAPNAPAAPAIDHHHPLLGAPLELADEPGRVVWEREISLATNPWLGDHRVQGAAIVPATAYIEMALAAGEHRFGDGSLSVQGIENLKPMILHDGIVRQVQATLVAEADGARLVVHSRVAGAAGGWTCHMRAKVQRSTAPDPADGFATLNAARERAADTLAGADFYAALERKGNEWGPMFQGVRELWLSDRESVGRIEVAAPLAAETARYAFHPAVSDACGHPLVATLPIEPDDGATGGAFVGAGVGEVRFHRRPVGRTLWTHALLRPTDGGDARVVHGDVRVYDERGALVSETLDARLRYLDAEAGGALLGAPDDWFHQLRWEPRELDAAAPGARAVERGAWIVLADRGGIGERIAALRAQAGDRTVLVAPGTAWHQEGDRIVVRADLPEDYRRLVGAVDDVTAVVHLWTSDVEPVEAGVESLLRLLHAVRGAALRPRLWTVTAATQAVVDGDRVDAPASALAWGLGRSLSVEHPDLWGGLVDIEPGIEADSAAHALMQEITQGGAEDKLALRGGRRHVARLVRRAPARTRREFVVRPDATYLVTGGLGGIGLAMAGWLVERGARHLLLAGRTPLPPRDAWAQLAADSADGRRVAAVHALEARGATVHLAAIDIAADGALARELAALAQRGAPAVRGVFHAAGILRFQALESLDVATLREVLSAKVDGAWALHRQFAEAPLDVFMLCSSTSTLLNSPLLGAYAAANAFLDALAHHRRARGLAALAVDWGTWGEVGMAVQDGRTATGQMLGGVGTIDTVRGLAALAELLEGGDVRAAVMPVDWAELARTHAAFASDPFLSVLIDKAHAQAEPRVAALTPAALRALPAPERADRLGAFLRESAARVLGLATERLDIEVPLASLGFDSLMAVQLKNRVETDLRVTMTMIQFLQGPSVTRLAADVMAQLDAQPVAQAQQATADAWEEGSL